MQSLPTVLLKPGEAKRVVAGHPWIYRGSVLRLTKEPADGAAVQVKDHRQRFLGVGYYNSKSKILVRVLANQRVELDRDFFERRILDSWHVRKRHMPGASSYRVVNSESDRLSGLIVDKYEDVLVVQFASLGMDCRKEMMVSLLRKIFSPRSIVERSDLVSRRHEGLEEATGILFGEYVDDVDMWMNGLRFNAKLMSGHKTGMYLDQQVNYQLTADLATRLGAKDALDCFCFQGGFSLHLAKAGVGSVRSLDQSEEAIKCASRNATANEFTSQCVFNVANVFDWLKREANLVKEDGKPMHRYDIIVLDPPSFTRNRSSVPDALRGYKEIHLRALKLLRPGGALVTFCCSYHVDENLFKNVILEAAFDARTIIRESRRFIQAPDHPIIPGIPETSYLKGYAVEIV